MKIKFTLLIIALFGLGLFFDSCIDNDKIDELNDELLYKVTESEAYAIAEKLLYLDRTKTYPTNEVSMENFTDQKKVKNLQTLLNDDDEEVLHILNYQSGGFVIIAADKRMPSILAHAEFGEFFLDEDILDNTGISHWLSEMIIEKEIVKADEYDKDFKNGVEQTWKKGRENPLPVHVACPEGTVIYDTLIDYPTWNQGNPYNKRLDSIICNSILRLPVTGCAATAVGQVLKSLYDNNKFNGRYTYFNHTQELDWGNMPSKPNQYDYGQIPDFMRHFGKAANSDYRCVEGTSTINDNTRDFLNVNCGFDAKLVSLKANIIRADLKNKKPVLMRGNEEVTTYRRIRILKMKWTFQASKSGAGHIWSIKGIKTLNGCETNNPLTHNYYMDWGWGGINNGWFWMNENHHRFKLNRQIIHNLGK